MESKVCKRFFQVVCRQTGSTSQGGAGGVKYLGKFILFLYLFIKIRRGRYFAIARNFKKILYLISRDPQVSHLKASPNLSTHMTYLSWPSTDVSKGWITWTFSLDSPLLNWVVITVFTNNSVCENVVCSFGANMPLSCIGVSNGI